MKKFKSILAVLFLFVSVSALAQNISVKGTVTDEKGEPVPFASVMLKGTSTGTATDGDGKFAINVPANGTLVVSFVGYHTVEVAVNGKTTVDCVLSADAEYLDDVLVVAYGTAKKESFTGSAQTVKADQLEKRTVANVTKALDGVAAGVQTTTGSGQPGSGASVIIRGFGSLSASTTPLYVVDGVPYDGSISAINPNDIESMTIIKDASAGALYGARGANGVVIITTKKGSDDGVKVNFKGNWGVASRALPRYETMDAFQWTEDVFYMFRNDYIAEGYDKYNAGILAAQEMVSGTRKIFGNKEEYNPFSVAGNALFDYNTGKIVSGTTLKWNDDWLGEAMAKNPLRQDYQMSVTGGNKKTKYMFSIGYLNEEGLVAHTNFQRFSGRANVDSQIKEWFKTGLNVSFAHNNTNMTTLGTSSSSSTGYSNVFYSCELMAPIYPLYQRNADGSYVLDANGERVYDWGENRSAGASAGWNPIANLLIDKYNSASDNVSGRAFADFGGVKEGALQGLKFSVNFGFDYVFTKQLTYYNPEFGNAVSKSGLSEIQDGRTFSYTFNQLLTYDRDFGRHHIDALVGHENYDYNYQYLFGYKSGFPFSGLYELAAATTLEDASSYQNDYKVESLLTRLNYSFDDKYYLSGSYRRDGSSRFHQDYRWGNFWSVGASWRISQENFLKDVSWINNITLKASYGVQGNDNIGSLYAWQSFYDLGFANGANPGAVVTSLENKELKWEKNENLNVGIEARFFNRLSLTVEYYNRYTKDMLMDYPMATSLGFSGYTKNIGNMLNRGVEFSISGDIISTDKVRWNMSLIGSTVQNKVLKLADKPEIVSGDYIIKEGYPINSFYLCESAGVDPATGNKLYVVYDTDENGVESNFSITDDAAAALQCRKIVGSRIPDIYGSWSNSLTVGNFDFSVMTTYSLGGKMNDGKYNSLLFNTYVGEAAHVDRLKAWKEPGDITNIPRIDVGGIYDINTTPDQLFDASYFAIKNVTLGYTFPSKWMKAINMKSLRLSVTADNVYIFTALKGMDPQYNFSGGSGYTYTPSRTVSVGLDITF